MERKQIRKIFFWITGHWTIGRHARSLGLPEMQFVSIAISLVLQFQHNPNYWPTILCFNFSTDSFSLADFFTKPPTYSLTHSFIWTLYLPDLLLTESLLTSPLNHSNSCVSLSITISPEHSITVSINIHEYFKLLMTYLLLHVTLGV